MAKYQTEFRADWTHPVQTRLFSDRKRAESYARGLSDRKHAMVYVVAWDGDETRGHKAFYNGMVDSVEGSYA